nr:hypothetical protein CcurKRNrm3_p158 [Cryptomonas curvata]
MSLKLELEVETNQIIFKKKKKNSIALGINIYKLFYKKLYKDLIWKKKLFDSFFSDIIAKNLNSIKKMQLVFLIKNIIKKTKNKKLIISLFLFFFKIGIDSSISNFLKYNLNYKKINEFILIFNSSIELDYYSSFRNSLILLTDGFSLEKNFKCLPKEYLRTLILFLKKITGYVIRNKNKQKDLRKLKPIIKILNVTLNIISSIQKWSHFENQFFYFFQIIVKEIWSLYKINFVAKFFEKMAKLKYNRIKKLYQNLPQCIISQLFIENIIIFEFLSRIDLILKCIKPKFIDIKKNNIRISQKLKPHKKQLNNLFVLFSKNQIEIDCTKKFFIYIKKKKQAAII